MSDFSITDERSADGKKASLTDATAVVPDIEKLKRCQDMVPDFFAQLETKIRKRQTKAAIEHLGKVRKAYATLLDGLIAEKETERLMFLSLGSMQETLDPYVDKDEYSNMA